MKPPSSRSIPSRLRRLDDALAALPLDEPMLLTELDGFLTGVLLSPEPIAPDEWLACIWGAEEPGEGGIAPFDNPMDVQWFVDAVTAQRDAIARDLARGKPRPIFDVDERGDVLWDYWVDGFAEAMALSPDGWAALAAGDDADAADALARLATLVAVARDEGALDSLEVNALDARAPGEIAAVVLALHAARAAGAEAAPEAVAVRPAKVGRNDPCRCGSGKKLKRCCG